ncbi:MAG: asparagine synthase-related protein, partial [Candidatus Sericytochromatia bacterium]
MSMIFGIFNRDGSPVEKTDIDDMYNAISYYPHEKYNYKIIENVVFGHLLTFNTPESLFEEQPIFFNDRNILFVFKGRIDNRKELCNKLNINLKDNLTDGEIALKSWLEWGEKSCDKILGDWSFASFNFKTQEFFISRDHHGYTAINYYYDEKRFIFASSIKSILNLNFIKKELNIKSVINTLAIFPEKKMDKSFYKNIYKLNPAQYIKCNREKFLLQRYWYPESISINKNKKFDEYVEEFYCIFENAVKDRLRSYKPICSMLSGGLDSGTVAYTASMLMKEQEKKLRTYSHVPLYEVSKNIHDLRFGDEKPYIESTVKASGNIEPIYLNSENISVLEGMIKTNDVLNSPIHAGVNAYWLVDIMKTSSSDEFGAILTGEHGNATISFSGYEDTLSVNYLYNQIGLKRIVKKKLIKPIVKAISPNLYRYLKKEPEISLETYSYINPELFDEIRNEMKKIDHDDKFDFKFSSHQEMCLKILMPSANPRCYFGGTFSDYYGIEMRDPTADKRVIEYILTIPNEIFFSKDGNNKQIIRKMMKNKLPND